MSDVIVFQREGDIQSYYVDRGGYLELPSFTGNERTAEESALSQVGTRSQPTVAELEADVKAGKSISLIDLANATHAERRQTTQKSRPSLLDRLEENKKKANLDSQSDTRKINAREV